MCDTHRARFSRLVDPQSSIPRRLGIERRTSDSILGETKYSHFNGKRNNCTFCHFLQPSPRWLIQRAGIWSVKSFDSLHGPAVTFAPHSSLTLARLAARETTHTLASYPFVSPTPAFTRIRTSYATRPNFSVYFFFLERKKKQNSKSIQFKFRVKIPR